MAKLILHGAAREVGRSCVEIKAGEERFLFDAGLRFSMHESAYPSHIKNLNSIKCILLSHAHLDHTGALPVLQHEGLTCPIFTTAATRSVCKILLKDNWKIENIKHKKHLYQEQDIIKVLERIQTVKYKKQKSFNGIKFEFIDAGHIPGASCIIATAGNKRMMYTGDFNTIDTNLLNGSKIDDDLKNSNLDLMITESTYGNREHLDRASEETRFLTAVENAVNKGDSVLIPTFAVGRSQEILLMLLKKNFGVPIFLDGMSRELTQIYLQQGRFLKNESLLQAGFNNVNLVKGHHQRQSVARKQGIFVTTSGMMDGGPIIDYLHMLNNPNVTILLTGYQTKGSNGSRLLKEGKLYLDHKIQKIKCSVDQFDFSAHLGLKELKQVIKNINPKKLVINHGEEDSSLNLNNWAAGEGFDVRTPILNEEVEF